jgi:Uma2 family endonuclease
MIQPTGMTIAQFEKYLESAPEGFIYELSVNGVILAFATGTEEHRNIITRLGNWISALDKPPRRTYFGSMSVRKHPLHRPTVVPDIMTTCEPPDRGRIFLLAPALSSRYFAEISDERSRNQAGRV